MKKYRFEQVPPEYQESPLFYCVFADGREEIDLICEDRKIRVFGNRDFRTHSCGLIDAVEDRLAYELGGTPDTSELLDALAQETGDSWTCCTIRGCCQSDWQDVIIRAKDADMLEWFEVEYFNTGSEWFDPDGIGGYYTHAWDNAGTKKELAEHYGCKPEEIELAVFDGWSRSATYTTA